MGVLLLDMLLWIWHLGHGRHSVCYVFPSAVGCCVLRVCLLVAVVAAHGGDDLLHAVLGVAVAGRPRVVQQYTVLLAWAHAYAGATRI